MAAKIRRLAIYAQQLAETGLKYIKFKPQAHYYSGQTQNLIILELVETYSKVLEKYCMFMS